LLLDANALAGEHTDPLGDLDEIAEVAARPARAAVEVERARLDVDESTDLEREQTLRNERAAGSGSTGSNPRAVQYAVLDAAIRCP